MSAPSTEEIREVVSLGLLDKTLYFEVDDAASHEEVINVLAAAIGITYQKHQDRAGSENQVGIDHFFEHVKTVVRNAAGAALAGDVEDYTL